MRRKYKNQLFQFLLNSKPGIDSFDLFEGEVGSLPATTINYKNSPFSFIIRNANHDFEMFDYKYVLYSPEYTMSEVMPKEDYVKFDIIIQALHLWLINHLSEYLADQNEPDLWEEYNKGNKSVLLNNMDFNDQALFSLDEKIQITQSLNEFKLLVKTGFNTTNEQQINVNARLDYLIEAADRLNKFDWKSLSLSTLIGISTSLSLDTTQGAVLFELFKKVFSFLPQLPH